MSSVSPPAAGGDVAFTGSRARRMSLQQRRSSIEQLSVEKEREQSAAAGGAGTREKRKKLQYVKKGPPPSGADYQNWKKTEAVQAEMRLAALEERVGRLAELEGMLRDLDAADQAATDHGWRGSAPTSPSHRNSLSPRGRQPLLLPGA
eukprot:CAMPEP_0114169910 /NCGR_PEP_ID=MMETSP0043_2-20121206/33837_1 /TAXON_ID=464988 /ORGANISM="Hemiselmis andersenii, Strain CCMP644" /LENGTH=147 /DNA_ID=CAMNT_0001267437 /DNA_START=20 /DNA_END=460 /DNA_ORIENTATION=-